MGYTYKGSKHDADEPAPLPTKPFDPSKCGTYAGHRQHQSRNVPTCQPCKDAAAAYRRDWGSKRRGRVIIKGFNPAKCGTRAGYAAHVYYKVPFCAPCRAANAAHSAHVREQAKAA